MARKPKRRIPTKPKGAGTSPAPVSSGGIKKRTTAPAQEPSTSKFKGRTSLPPPAPEAPEIGGEVGAVIRTITDSGKYGNAPFKLASSPAMRRAKNRTGILTLDLALGGGWTRGSAGMLYGEKSCLAGDTFVNYHVVQSNGKVSNTKGGTIEQLFNRFHGNPSGKGAYMRPGMENCTYTAPSIDCSGAVLHNVIEDVWEAGEQECFLVTTSRGHTIKATDRHRFYTGEDYVRLSLLQPGDTVYMHENVYRLKEEDKQWKGDDRAYVYVKRHPVAGVKISNGYRYHRLAKSRAVVEADMNGLDYHHYIDRLNAGVLDDLTFLSRDQHVHYKDHDHTNDSLDNLEVMSNEEHGLLHGATSRRGVVFEAVPDEIISIESVGVTQTYDIQMRDPYNNFVANRFVVHNSGKTTMALQSIASLQRREPDTMAAWLDIEGTLDMVWAQKLGVDLDRLIVAEPETGEHAVDLADGLLRAREVGMVVTDSIAMLVPMKELDESAEQETMALQARLVGKYIRKTNNALLKERSQRGHAPVLIHINQFRMKVGLVFGDPRTLPGGKALEFSTTQQVEAKNKEIIGKDSDGNDVVMHNEHTFKITKNKGGGPMKEGAFKLIRTDGVEGLPEATVSQAKTIYKHGTAAGLITGAPSSFEIDGIDGKFRGAPAFNEWSLENPDAYDDIQGRIVDAYKARWNL